MIRRMLASDVAACMRLKQAAGWNQVEQDWRTVMAVEPEGCWVDERGGVVAGSTTAVCYGSDLAWIGMVLVLPEFRRQGIARGLMEHALRWLEERDVAAVGLDATDMGRPLYASLGFEDWEGVTRWGRTAQSAEAVALGPDGGEPLPYALDQEAFGVDRRRLLDALAGSGPDGVISVGDGYLMSRPGSGARFLGPVVARTPAVAAGLIREAVGRYGGEDLLWDFATEHAAAADIARECGFAPLRDLRRMVLPRNPARPWVTKPAWLYGAAGFEYG